MLHLWPKGVHRNRFGHSKVYIRALFFYYYRRALYPLERLTVSVIYRIVTKTIGPVPCAIRSRRNVLLYTDENITIIFERPFSADITNSSCCPPVRAPQYWDGIDTYNIWTPRRDHDPTHLNLYTMSGYCDIQHYNIVIRRFSGRRGGTTIPITYMLWETHSLVFYDVEMSYVLPFPPHYRCAACRVY